MQLEMWWLTEEVVCGLRRGALYAIRRAHEYVGAALAADAWEPAVLQERLGPVAEHFVVPLWWMDSRAFTEGFYSELEAAIKDIGTGVGRDSKHVRWLLEGAP